MTSIAIMVSWQIILIIIQNVTKHNSNNINYI